MITIDFAWKALNSLKLSDLIPTPDYCFSLAPYPRTAALIGAGYGKIGQILNPQSRMAPLPYAICFEGAYLIKECFDLLARFFKFYLNKLKEAESQQASQKGKLFSEICSAYCKINRCQEEYFQKFDLFFSRLFRIRSYEEVQAASLSEASWMEVCRHRFWQDLKVTIINSCSLSLSYRLCDYMGFILPYRNLSFVILMIQSIAFEIFVMPVLFYLYHRVKHYVVEKANQETGVIAAIARGCRLMPSCELL